MLPAVPSTMVDTPGFSCPPSQTFDETLGSGSLTGHQGSEIPPCHKFWGPLTGSPEKIECVADGIHHTIIHGG